MSVIITSKGNFGPFKSIEILEDRLHCDNTDLCFTVIGNDYSVSEDDSLIPAPPPVPEPVPQVVSMRQARLALHAAGLLATIDAAIAAQGEAAAIEWQYATEVSITHPLVVQIGAALGTDIDALFRAAAQL